MADEYINAQDLTEDTSLDGEEQFVMFDSTMGKRAKLKNIKTYINADNAQPDGYYPELTAGNADVSAVATAIAGGSYTEESVPYKFRHTGGNITAGEAEEDCIVGGTIAWNQLCNGASVTVPNNHKYIMSKSGASSMGISTGSAITGLTSGTDMVHDLTQMFGSAVADYIYNLEHSSAGKGVAFFRNMFPESYYEYNAGELKSVSGLQSHDTVGFNLWDEVWERGAYDVDDGSPYDVNQIRSKNYIPVLSDTNYYIKANPYVWMMFFDDNKNILTADLPNTGASAGNARGLGDQIFKTPIGCAFIKFYCQASYGTTYNNDICINLSWSGWRNGEYEAYQKHSYPLDSSLTLRGVPKLSADNTMYYDGDTYESDGTVTRKYGTRAYQSGDESLANAITDGTNTVYKLTDETTETAEPYTKVQTCDDFGTEEYVSTSIVPVGHKTKYYDNLTKRIDKLPSAIAPLEKSATSSANYSVGDYLILNNTLYKVTSAISAGGTITAGSNVTATTIMAEIKALR